MPAAANPKAMLSQADIWARKRLRLPIKITSNFR